MADIKFIADVMVGKLARWLRILGFDTAYSNKYEDDELLRVANDEDRIILTRDRGLAARRAKVRCLLIASDNYKEQLRQVIDAVGINHQFSVFSRCLQCNALLTSIDKEAVFERVPAFVYLTQERFAACPLCHRIYWHGTHADEMLKRIP